MTDILISLATVIVVLFFVEVWDSRRVDAETKRILKKRRKIKRIAEALKREREGMFRHQ